jgi:aldehyde dehydrogenase (NAD+)
MTATESSVPSTTIDAARLVERLRTTFRSGRTRPVSWRKEQLAGLRRMMEEAEDELVDALRRDLGRPRLEAFVADIGHTKGELRHLHRHVERWTRPTRARVPLTAAPARASIRPEPLGVALVIAPWNYPVQLLVEPIAAALAAGNCVVGKPSELAPACSAAIARLLPCYVDPDAVAIVEGAVEETTELLEQRWDHIFFTGSTSVGRVVAEAAARHLTPTTLELGGKSPTYVHASADLDVAARRIAWGKFLNAGQTCIAPDYVLADRAIREELVERIGRHIDDFYKGDPQSSTSFGRIVSDRHLERLRGLLAGAGTTPTSGGTIDASTRYVAPTIVVDPPADSALMQEEIFGPILPVLAVDGPQEAVATINARPKPLALYVFAEDDEAVEAVVGGTSSGGVCVNQTLMHLLPPALPFGGVGDSGMGSYHGKAGFDAFSHHKSILRKPTRPDLAFLYPPYNRVTERIVRLVAR